MHDPAAGLVVGAASERAECGLPRGVSLARGALVLDRGGDDVGVVDDVRLDSSTGRLEGLGASGLRPNASRPVSSIVSWPPRPRP